MYPFYYYPSYYPPSYYYPYETMRPSSPVDVTIFHQSAIQSKRLMKEASIVLDKLADSKEFDAQLMYAAQASDIAEVKRLIHSIGITSDVDIHFNPDGLRLEFKSKAAGADCCHLLIALRWR